MTLTFPTIAEQVAAEFKESSKTTSIATLAKKRNAEVTKDFNGITYTFEDDTSLVTSGAGRAHKVETFLP